MARPKIFNSPEELQEKINEYFLKCEQQDKPLTMSGLAVACDVDRKTIVNYSADQEFFPTIKKARDIVEAYAEEQLYRNGTVTGIIFNLKNNFGWVDKQTNETLGEDGEPVDPNKVKVEVVSAKHTND